MATPHKCPLCDKGHTNLSNYFLHLMKQHPKQEAAAINELKRLQRDIPNDDFQCLHCYENFLNDVTLRCHLEIYGEHGKGFRNVLKFLTDFAFIGQIRDTSSVIHAQLILREQDEKIRNINIFYIIGHNKTECSFSKLTIYKRIICNWRSI